MSGGRLTPATFAPVDQHYLLRPRQMQTMSFAVHIPLVAFGISFPARVFVSEMTEGVRTSFEHSVDREVEHLSTAADQR